MKIGNENFTDSPYFLTEEAENLTLLEKISDIFQRCVQDFSQYLFKKGWVIPSLILPAILGEPGETMRSAVRRIFGWKTTWEKCGFYHAGDSKSLQKLSVKLQENDPVNHLLPVLLFHGIYSSPDIWIPWSRELQKSQKKGEIGHVMTLQLPSDLEERMKIVYQVINDIVATYQQANRSTQVDLVGHSLGGYAAHLAAFQQIKIKDEKDGERRWHSIDPNHRNPNVRKVISIAAPTWLCCDGQHDETTECGTHKGIYPWKALIEKTVEGSFTSDQVDAIQKSHQEIYDIVATQDGISPTISPLASSQVFKFKLGHLGVATSKKVCKAASLILHSSNITCS